LKSVDVSVKYSIRQTRFDVRTFSSCWKELGCCALSIALDGTLGARTGRVGGVLGRLEGTRKELGETIDEAISREAAALLFLSKSDWETLALRSSMTTAK
jgi:hypothetical protein